MSGALSAIKAAGGGVVEAYAEQVEGRSRNEAPTSTPARESLFEELGFTRDHGIVKWR